MISLNTSCIEAADKSRISAAPSGLCDPSSTRIANAATHAGIDLAILRWPLRMKATIVTADMVHSTPPPDQDFFGKEHFTKPFNPARGLKMQCLGEMP